MYGMFVALGSPAKGLTRDAIATAVKNVSPSQVDCFTLDPDLCAAVFTPSDSRTRTGFLWTPDGKLGVALDGYLLTEAPGGPTGELPQILQMIERGGLTEALGAIVSGSFNLLELDLARGVFAIANDRFASIPFYYALVEDGCLASTNPTLLSGSGLVSRDIDPTAWAELMHIGYTIGDRYFLKDIRVLPPASILRWERRARRCAVSTTDLSPFVRLPEATAPDLSAVAAAVGAACRRLAGRGGRTAQLQSGGMDSRLILAAWPEEQPLPCYTYGHPGLAEVSVARALAGARGAAFTHVSLEDGDAVADALEEMYLLNGPSIWPDRYLTARTLRDHGFDHVADGFLGDAFLGGLHHSSLGSLARMRRGYAGRAFFRARIGDVGLDLLAEALFANIADPGAEAFLGEYLDKDVARRLTGERANILHDIVMELKRLRPANDSLALLVRNFKISNRSLHMILQQGAMCRQFLQVYYPLSNDVPLLDMLLRIPLHMTAHHRLYIELYRRHFPDYANVPYAASLLPLKRSSLAHRCSEALLVRGRRVPFVTGRLSGSVLKVDKWATWLQGSDRLRGKAVTFLAEYGLADPGRLHGAMERIAQGTARGSGDLLMLAGLGRLQGERPSSTGQQMGLCR